MKIAELINGKKNRQVRVRVPVKLQSKLGIRAKGRVQRIRPKGSVTWVEVKIGAVLYSFRPQDLSPA